MTTASIWSARTGPESSSSSGAETSRYCRRGHTIEGENVIVLKGRDYCRRCKNDQQNENNRRKREKKRAAERASQDFTDGGFRSDDVSWRGGVRGVDAPDPPGRELERRQQEMKQAFYSRNQTLSEGSSVPL